ncbi:MAG: hypothetical protein RLZZ352_2539 [Pseudomonadota bacterium]|jgi:tetraacyldisaccharide 4'-kinase
MAASTAASARRQARWQALAQQRGWQAWLLRPVAGVYGALVALRRWAYAHGHFQTHTLPVPVIVVGNVVVGGAGKTPTVIALVQHLRRQGWRPGVVSRGYGRHSDAVLEVTAQSPTGDTGDEPALIQRATAVPVFVGRQRHAAARALLAAYPETNVLLCDDGLQHWALKRDVAVAVFDERGCGNGWLLPAGLLREPWPPAPDDPWCPDVVLHQHRATQPAAALPASKLPQFRAVRQLAPYAINPQGQQRPLAHWRNTPVCALAGVARPEVFFDMLRAQGLTLARTVALPDHADASAYAELLQGTASPWLCTEKDAVKCFALPQTQPAAVWAVPLELVPEVGFLAAVEGLLVKAQQPPR